MTKENVEQKVERKVRGLAKWVLIPLAATIIGAGIGWSTSEVYYKKSNEIVHNRSGDPGSIDFVYAMKAGVEGYIEFRNKLIAIGIGTLSGAALGLTGVYAHNRKRKKVN